MQYVLQYIQEILTIEVEIHVLPLIINSTIIQYLTCCGGVTILEAKRIVIMLVNNISRAASRQHGLHVVWKRYRCNWVGGIPSTHLMDRFSAIARHRASRS
jgi:hypothetical protein